MRGFRPAIADLRSPAFRGPPARRWLRKAAATSRAAAAAARVERAAPGLAAAGLAAGGGGAGGPAGGGGGGTGTAPHLSPRCFAAPGTPPPPGPRTRGLL